MKLKLGIIYGILIWFFVYLITVIFSPLITDNIPYINIVAPIAIITVTGFFGILYIRDIDENEVIEGFKIGIIFILKKDIRIAWRGRIYILKLVDIIFCT